MTAASDYRRRSVLPARHAGAEAGLVDRPFAGVRALWATSAECQPPAAARRVEVGRPNRAAGPAAEEFLAAAAHELRLPLGHIKGFVTSLRRSDVEWDAETRRDFLAEIDRETDRLEELVDGLLSGRAHGSGAPAADLAVTQPAAVVKGALRRLRGFARERSLRLEVQPSLPAVRMDASAMERVLANLIQNALKYSPAATPIGVAVRKTAEGDLAFTVEDEGPGIPVEDRERIFEPFVRALSTVHERVPGHGLGLAICRSIVLAHGGRIQVSERPGGGARFTVLLPTHAPSSTGRGSR